MNLFGCKFRVAEIIQRRRQRIAFKCLDQAAAILGDPDHLPDAVSVCGHIVGGAAPSIQAGHVALVRVGRRVAQLPPLPTTVHLVRLFDQKSNVAQGQRFIRANPLLHINSNQFIEHRLPDGAGASRQHTRIDYSVYLPGVNALETTK